MINSFFLSQKKWTFLSCLVSFLAAPFSIGHGSANSTISYCENTFFSDADYERFQSQGYAIVPQLLNDFAVTRLLEASDDFYDSAQRIFNRAAALGWFDDLVYLSSKGAMPFSINDRSFRITKVDLKAAAIHVEDRGSILVIGRKDSGGLALHRVVWATAAHPEIMSFINLQMKRILRETMGGTHAEWIISQFHYKMPGDGVSFPPHQDIEHRVANDATFDESIGLLPAVHIITALTPHSAINGGLVFLSGNARINHHLKNNPARQALVIENTAFHHTPTLRPGDAIILSPYNVHFSFPNLSRQSRQTLILGFAAISENGQRANHGAYPGQGSGLVITLDEDKP